MSQSSSRNVNISASSNKGREQWMTRTGLVLAMAGNAIGLGNFLRFPVQCANNGGGAFMIPYFIAFFLLGIPLMWIEWGVGRFGGKYGYGTTPGMFHCMWRHPMAKYLGAIGIAIPFCLVLYYTYIVSWTLAYSVFSVTGKYFGIESRELMAQFLSGYQGVTKNQFFNGIGTAYVFFLITFGINMWILSRGLVRGIEWLAKWALPTLGIFGLILMVRIFTLGTPDPAFPDRSVINGLAFIWNPDFSSLTDVKVWLAATGQVFFTLSLGFGAIQTYASYMKPKDDIALSGLGTASANGFAEVVLGGSIAIPVAVAFFGLQGTQEIASRGAFDLGFFAMPVIVQQLPMGELFGALWFLLLFIAGITSSVAMSQPMMAFLQEEFKIERKKAAQILGGLMFVLMQPVIFFMGHGFLDEMDFWIGTFGLVVFAVIEVVLFIWVFGADKAWREINVGADIKIPNFFFFIIKYVTPIYLIGLLIVWFFQSGLDVLMMTNVAAEDQIYIWFARFLLVGVLVFMMVLVRIAWQRKDHIRQVVP